MWLTAAAAAFLCVVLCVSVFVLAAAAAAAFSCAVLCVFVLVLLAAAAAFQYVLVLMAAVFLCEGVLVLLTAARLQFAFQDGPTTLPRCRRCQLVVTPDHHRCGYLRPRDDGLGGGG